MAMARRRQRPKTLDDWMTERLEQLGMTWTELEAAAGVTKKTMLNIRRGGSSYPRTVRNVEAKLRWALGSINAIKEGGEPTVVDVDAVIRRPVVDVAFPPAATDYAAQLRIIRQLMGPAAFWREVGAMQSEEESTERDRPHATG